MQMAGSPQEGLASSKACVRMVLHLPHAEDGFGVT
jgi:hypothetical protein